MYTDRFLCMCMLHIMLMRQLSDYQFNMWRPFNLLLFYFPPAGPNKYLPGPGTPRRL